MKKVGIWSLAHLNIHNASTRKKTGCQIKLIDIPIYLGTFLDFTFDFQTIIYFFKHGIIRVLNNPDNVMAPLLNQILVDGSSVIVDPGFYQVQLSCNEEYKCSDVHSEFCFSY
jgi:hypothetical protein